MVKNKVFARKCWHADDADASQRRFTQIKILITKKSA